MSDLLFELLPVAVAIALSPFPIVPVILLLLTGRPRANGGSFLAGWFGGILVLAGVFTVAASLIALWDEVPTWASWTRIVLGIVLIVLGVRKWVAGGSKKQTPAWMESIAGYTPLQSLRLGALLSAANPKVLLLALAGGVAIGAAELGPALTSAAVLVFAVVAAITVATPVVLHLFLGERITGPLNTAKTWLVANNETVMSVVVIAIGAMVLLKGIGGL